MSADLSQDYKFFDGVETLTLINHAGDETSVEYCLRSDLTAKEVQFGQTAGWEADVIAFDIPKPELAAGWTPKRGYQLKDTDDVRYVIVSSVYWPLTQQYRVVANQATANG